MNLRKFKFMETWIITVIDILENQKYESINNSTKKIEFSNNKCFVWLNLKSNLMYVPKNYLLLSNSPLLENKHPPFKILSIFTHTRHSENGEYWMKTFPHHPRQWKRSCQPRWAQHEPNQLINQSQLQIRSLNWQIISPSALVHSNLAVAHPPPG